MQIQLLTLILSWAWFSSLFCVSLSLHPLRFPFAETLFGNGFQICRLPPSVFLLISVSVSFLLFLFLLLLSPPLPDVGGIWDDVRGCDSSGLLGSNDPSEPTDSGENIHRHTHAYWLRVCVFCVFVSPFSVPAWLPAVYYVPLHTILYVGYSTHFTSGSLVELLMLVINVMWCGLWLSHTKATFCAPSVRFKQKAVLCTLNLLTQGNTWISESEFLSLHFPHPITETDSTQTKAFIQWFVLIESTLVLSACCPFLVKKTESLNCFGLKKH